MGATEQPEYDRERESHRDTPSKRQFSTAGDENDDTNDFENEDGNDPGRQSLE